jgi:hypothetical protein
MTDIERKYILTTWDLSRRIFSFSAALIGTLASIYPKYLMYGLCYIKYYILIDLFFARQDMLVHHILVLSFFAGISIHTFSEEYKYYIVTQLMRFEYSTIFYNGGPILLHYLSSRQSPKITYWIPAVITFCNFGFSVTFFKIRIYDFANNVIFLANIYSPEHFPSIIAFVHIISTPWVFYALNL